MFSASIDELLTDLIGDRNKQPLVKKSFESDGRRIGREEKISMVLIPELQALIKQHKSSYKSYYSWILNGDHRANKVRKEMAEYFDANTEKVLTDTEKLCYQLLYIEDVAAYDPKRFLSLMTGDFARRCFKFSSARNDNLKFHLQYLCSADPSRALAAAFLYLLFYQMPNGKSSSSSITDPAFAQRTDILFSVNSQTLPVETENKDQANIAYEYGMLLYHKGEFQKALSEFLRISGQALEDDSFQRKNELCYQIARMFQQGNGCKPNENRAYTYFKKAIAYGPLGYYELHLCALKGLGCEQNNLLAKKYLLQAAENDSYPAVRDLAIAYYRGNEDLEIAENLDEAEKLLIKGTVLENQSATDGSCHYMLGQLRLDQGFVEEASDLFETAARSGHPYARQSLLHLHPNYSYTQLLKNTGSAPKASSMRGDSPFVCENPDENDLFLCNSLLDNGISPGREPLISEPGFFLSLAQKYITESFLSDEDKHSLYIYLFSKDQKANLKDALDLIHYLRSFMEKAEYIDYFLNHLVIYVRTDQRVAELMIDSAIATLEPNYLRVRICNEYLDAADDLMMKAPLFLNNYEPEPVVTILGHGNAAFWLVKTILGNCHTVNDIYKAKSTTARAALRIVVLDPQADLLEKRLKSECPGIFRCTDLISEKVLFFDHTPESSLEDESLRSTLLSCRYFIQASDDSSANISGAINLRELLLRNDPNFENNAFIAAYCPDSSLNWQAKRLSVGDQLPGYSWYNNFNICFFGGLEQLYAPQNLFLNISDYLGWLIHKTYFQPITDQEKLHRARFAFYSCYYNRDTSRGAGIGALFHLYAMGIRLSNWRDYATRAGLETLAADFDKWSADHDHPLDPELERFSAAEHERWNNFMLTRGWLPATIDQMEKYMQKGTLKHHLSIARIHPFICSWEALGDANTGIQYEVGQVLMRRNPDASAPNIKQYDRNNIRVIGQLLKEAALLRG